MLHSPSSGLPGDTRDTFQFLCLTLEIFLPQGLACTSATDTRLHSGTSEVKLSEESDFESPGRAFHQVSATCFLISIGVG